MIRATLPRVFALAVMMGLGTGSAFSQASNAPVIATPKNDPGTPETAPEINVERNKNAVTDTTGSTNTGAAVRLPPASARSDPGAPETAPEINLEKNKNAVQSPQ